MASPVGIAKFKRYFHQVPNCEALLRTNLNRWHALIDMNVTIEQLLDRRLADEITRSY